LPANKATICLPYEDDLALISAAVKKGGDIARKAFYANDSKVWDKSSNHPVTDADIAVNDFLETYLMSARPNYGWLSEETKDDYSRETCPRTFVIDPIDGTRAFIDRTENFAVSVAVIENGVSIAGALYNPLTDELFTAAKGHGASLNGASMRCSFRDQLEGCKMIGYPRKFRRQGWPDMDVHVANSMAYRIALVACGKADATVAFTPKSDWDVAAAELIAREAGADISDLRGRNFRYDEKKTTQMGVICAGPNLMPLIKKRLKLLIEAAELSDNPLKEFAYLGTRMTDRKSDTEQLLHIVFGGELVDPMKTEFIDLSKMDFVGAYPNYAKAHSAWKAAAQQTVDNAHMRYFILHAHELIDPDKDGIIG